nr:GNAT family N-acetyltransferase [Paracoccus saliphilus]
MSATASDLQALADLHARCFLRPAPWTTEAFAGILAGRGTFLLAEPQGFLLGRALAGEAELLTLAVAPEARRHGLGRCLVARFQDECRARDVEDAFLEVAEDNLAARQLYRSLGWLEAGIRRRYYGPATDAVVMRLTLHATQEGG